PLCVQHFSLLGALASQGAGVTQCPCQPLHWKSPCCHWSAHRSPCKLPHCHHSAHESPYRETENKVICVQTDSRAVAGKDIKSHLHHMKLGWWSPRLYFF
ncbi:unnamed protein product, partial [Discosporangium mesarthrocarpum]